MLSLPFSRRTLTASVRSTHWNPVEPFANTTGSGVHLQRTKSSPMGMRYYQNENESVDCFQCTDVQCTHQPHSTSESGLRQVVQSVKVLHCVIPDTAPAQRARITPRSIMMNPRSFLRFKDAHANLVGREGQSKHVGTRIQVHLERGYLLRALSDVTVVMFDSGSDDNYYSCLVHKVCI